jgi:SRSO17 transposase
VQNWAVGLEEVHRRIAGAFARAEPRARVLAYLRGLLGQLERKNGWTLAEAAGEVSPDGMQRLLRTADWNADAVRDELRGYVVERLGPDGVLIIDEIGFIKKGVRSAGVARQHTGTTGKIDSCQIGVFLAYATDTGRALIDRELYLPRAWTDDRERAGAAGIGDEVGFATKPELARRMLTRALEDGVPVGWLTADELYGQDKRLRVWCEQHGLPYVLATRSNDTVATVDWRQRRVRALIAELPPEARGSGLGLGARPAPARTANGSTTGPASSCWPGSTPAGPAGCSPAAPSPQALTSRPSWPTTSAPGRPGPPSSS